MIGSKCRQKTYGSKDKGEPAEEEPENSPYRQVDNGQGKVTNGLPKGYLEVTVVNTANAKSAVLPIKSQAASIVIPSGLRPDNDWTDTR